MASINTKNKIILNKTPLRLSIVGGGTELPDYFKKYGGAVINSSINLFIITKVQKYKKNYLRIFLGDSGKLKIFKINRMNTNDKNFKIHIAVYDYINRNYLNSKSPSLSISTSSDIPPGSGLGTSSTLTVSLIKSLSSYFNLNLSKMNIAKIAFKIERENLKLKGGLQDHLSATFGGMNLFSISKSGDIKVKKLTFKKELFEKFKLSILLIYTGIARDSSKVIEQNTSNIKKGNNQYLNYLHNQKKNIFKIIKFSKQNDLEKLCEEINKNWDYKNKLISNKYSTIKSLLNKLKKNGVYSCKLSGAGNGGFIFCIYDSFKYYGIRKLVKMHKNFFIIKPSLYKHGTKSIYIKN